MWRAVMSRCAASSACVGRTPAPRPLRASVARVTGCRDAGCARVRLRHTYAGRRAWALQAVRSAAHTGPCRWSSSVSSAGAQADPAAATYVSQLCDGQPTPFSALVGLLDCLQATSSRNEVIAHMSDFFARVNACTPDDLPTCVGLVLGQVAPVYEGVRLRVGDALLLQAAADMTGTPVAELKKWATKDGTPINSVWSHFTKPEDGGVGAPLSVDDVRKGLIAIAKEDGTGSTARRQEGIVALWRRCGSDLEREYLLRIVQGKLRVGAQAKSVYAAVAHALYGGGGETVEPSVVASVQSSFAAHGNMFTVVESLQRTQAACDGSSSEGASGVPSASEAHTVTPGVPVTPMLGVAATDCAEIVKRYAPLGEFALDYKLDGERVQVHWARGPDGTATAAARDGAVFNVFSRRTEDMTAKYPDAVDAAVAAAAPGITSFVLDGEAVAVDGAGQLMPFQHLTTRARKGSGDQAPEVDVCVYAFDLLLLNGVSLLDLPLRVRRALLEAFFSETESVFQVVPSTTLQRARHASAAPVEAGTTEADDGAAARGDDGDDAYLEAQLMACVEEAVNWGAEGLMAKPLEGQAAVYRAGTRTKSWMKLKKDFDGRIGGDTLDLVPIAAYWGKGSRKGVYGSFVMACVADEGRLVSVCKLGTGLTDSELQRATAELPSLAGSDAGKPPQFEHVAVHPEPDVWFEPSEVWEVRASDLTLSRIHTAGSELAAGQDYAGIGLRFPRFVRRRPDKGVAHATTSQQVATMYASQGHANVVRRS